MMNNNDTQKETKLFTLPIITTGVLFMMGLWGCLAIYSASGFSEHPFKYAGRQLLWLIIGILVLIISSKIKFRFYEKNIIIIGIIAYISLFGVLINGTSFNGMKGWYNLGICLLQPSEIIKPIYILTLSTIFKNNTTSKKTIIFLPLLTLLWAIPIILQPDFGTLTVYIFGAFAVYLLAGGQKRYLLCLALLGAIFALYIFYTKSYVAARITGYLNPNAHPNGSGWHILQLQYALARGGISGTSWGKALWSNNYLPLAYSDSSFASLTESIGFIGALPVILGFTTLAIAGYKLSQKAKSKSYEIFIFSATTLITAQAFIHMSVNVALLPPTGITLPLFSYGGSSMISTMLCFGMILSAAKEK